MKRTCKAIHLHISTGYSLLALLLIIACGRPAGIGIGGRYSDAKTEITRGRQGDLSKAIAKLEYVVVRDPSYEDSLTLLGRAYYGAGRYQDAAAILQRALAVHPKDEIAWITLGLTQLRMGDHKRGLENFKGGITLLYKASNDPYSGREISQGNSQIRRALRRAVFYAAKGLEEKENMIRSGEALLSGIDNEEWHQKQEQFSESVRPEK